MFLPVLGCNGPYPAPGGACSGYLLESDSGKTRVVLDLGSGTLSRLCALCDPASEIDAVILSHLHFDHMSDVTVLGYLLDFSPRETMKLVCPDTPADVRKLIKGKFDVYPPKDFTLGEFDIQLMRVKHPVETYAVKVICDDSIFVYTDGVPEATNANNELFGPDRTLDSLNREPDASQLDLLTNLQNDINDFVGDAVQFDDITLLVFDYLGGEDGKGKD